MVRVLIKTWSVIVETEEVRLHGSYAILEDLAVIGPPYYVKI